MDNKRYIRYVYKKNIIIGFRENQVIWTLVEFI
jgi:hypothetical protein